jgi:hypothetical protein
MMRIPVFQRIAADRCSTWTPRRRPPSPPPRSAHSARQTRNAGCACSPVPTSGPPLVTSASAFGRWCWPTVRRGARPGAGCAPRLAQPPFTDVALAPTVDLQRSPLAGRHRYRVAKPAACGTWTVGGRTTGPVDEEAVARAVHLAERLSGQGSESEGLPPDPLLRCARTQSRRWLASWAWPCGRSTLVPGTASQSSGWGSHRMVSRARRSSATALGSSSDRPV